MNRKTTGKGIGAAKARQRQIKGMAIGSGTGHIPVSNLKTKVSEAMETPIIHLLRAEEVAKMLGCSKWFIYKLAKQKKLPSISIGRTVRFDPKDVVEFVNQRRQRKEVPCEHPQERQELPDRLLLQRQTAQGDGRPVPEGSGSRTREEAGRDPRGEVLRQVENPGNADGGSRPGIPGAVPGEERPGREDVHAN